MTTTTSDARSTSISASNGEQIDKANATGLTPVVFIHGLWLLPSSWDRWATLFEEAGYTALTPGWPDDPETVAEANAHPEVFAHKSVGQVADHYEEVIGKLEKKPAVIGHSFGGLLTQIIAGRGLSAVSVAIDPAPFRGVLPLRRRPRDVRHHRRAQVRLRPRVRRLVPQSRQLALDLGDADVLARPVVLCRQWRRHDRPSRCNSSSEADGPHVPAA